MSRLFGEIRQLGFVVRDIQAEMRHWSKVLQVGPWFLTERIPVENFHYKGQSAAIEVSVALATSEGGSDGIIGFEGSGRKTTTRLLSGEYPRYQTLLPSEFSAVAELPAAPFADAVKRVALVAERNTPVRLTFSSGEVLLEAGTGDEAQASEAIGASFDGETMQIAFNPTYLLDGINAVDSDTVRVSFTTATKPAVITGKADGQPDYRYVLMPIRSAG